MPRYRIAEVREITRSPRMHERSAISSSVRPSAKKAFSGSGLRLSKGRTTIDGRLLAVGRATRPPERPASRSRLRSASSSVAVWYRRSRSFSSAFRITRSSSAAARRCRRRGPSGARVQDRVEDHGCGGPREGRRPGGHLVEHDPEREEVAPRVHGLAEGLLGRHVGDRSERRPRRGEALLGRAARRCLARARDPRPTWRGRSRAAWPGPGGSRRRSPA